MVRRSTMMFALPFLLALLFPISVLGAEPPGQGVIEGRVINGTTGGDGVADLEVLLRSAAGQQQAAAIRLRADAQGRFRFVGLDTTSGRTYLATVEYQGAAYSTEVMTFQSGETTKSVELAVYEPTTEAGQLRVQRAHVIIEVDPQSRHLAIMELLMVSSGSNRAYVGSKEAAPFGRKETLRVKLPDGATELRPSEALADRLVAAGDGFVYTGPIVPAGTQLTYSYLVPFTGDSSRVDWSLGYPVERLNVLLPDQGVKISSDRLQEEAPPTLGDKRYLHLAGQNLPASAPVVLQLTNLSAKSSDGLDSARWVLPGLLVLGMALALGYSLRRRGRRKYR